MYRNGRAVSVEDAEGVSDGEDNEQMNPRVHAGCNHLGSVTTAGSVTGAVFFLVICLEFATYMFVLAQFLHAFPRFQCLQTGALGSATPLACFFAP